MSESGQTASGNWWRTPRLYFLTKLQEREDHVFLVLALVIGALTGLTVVAFILLTEREGLRLYPGAGSRGRRFLSPSGASLATGSCCFGIFPMGAAAECRKPRLRCSRA